MILLSAHRDVVMKDYRFEYSNGAYKGLLDNMVGVLAVTSLMLEERSLQLLEQEGDIKLFFGQGEEWGLNYDFPKLTKRDLVIVVDVASGPQYKNIDFSIENINCISGKQIKTIKENLEWEGFKFRTKKYNGDPLDEDEAFEWVKLGIPVFSFIIPIQDGSKNTGWHVDDCTITIEQLNKARRGLLRTINYLI